VFGNLEFYSVENCAGFTRQEQQPDLLSRISHISRSLSSHLK